MLVVDNSLAQLLLPLPARAEVCFGGCPCCLCPFPVWRLPPSSVPRDVKPGNIVSFGSCGTFKLIDMDSIYYTRSWEEEDTSDDDDESAAGSEQVQPPALQQHQPQQPQQAISSSGGGMAGHPCPASLSAHLAGGAAALVAAAALAAAALPLGGDGSEAQQQQQQQQLNALTFAGTPENMAPEVAPTVVQLAVVLWDLFPLQEGQQVASSTAIAPAQDIWSTGTVLYELLTGR
jgi:serine/threonine protein kinase